MIFRIHDDGDDGPWGDDSNQDNYADQLNPNNEDTKG